MNELPTRQLGRTGLRVTELGLGGYQFTGEFKVPRADARDAITEAIGSGINLIDTAPMYGAGESEELIGRAAAAGAGRDIHISGKIGYLELTVTRHLGASAYQDEDALRRVVAHSLHLLRRSEFDVLYIHEPEWPEWGLNSTTGDAVVTAVLERLKKEGLARAIGVAGQDAELNAALIQTNRFDVVLSVMHYDLTTSDARASLLPAAERHGVGVILGTPLRQGLLARAHSHPVAAMVADAERPLDEQEALARKLTSIYRLARETGMSLPELALRYLLSDKRVSSVIPGARSAADVQLNVQAALKGPLPADLLTAIGELQITSQGGRTDEPAWP